MYEIYYNQDLERRVRAIIEERHIVLDEKGKSQLDFYFWSSVYCEVHDDKLRFVDSDRGVLTVTNDGEVTYSRFWLGDEYIKKE